MFDEPKVETPFVALDCEMVEVDGYEDGLARVSIVNFNGQVLLDTFVKPEGKITNFWTWVSGVYPKHMYNATPLKEALQKVSKILKDKIIIGHALKNDFKVLQIEDYP